MKGIVESRSTNWRRLDGRGSESFHLLKTFRGWKLQGLVSGPPEEGFEHVLYEIRVDGAWRTRDVRVTVEGGGLPRNTGQGDINFPDK